MANKAISELTPVTQVNDADSFVLEQSGSAMRLTGAKLKQTLQAYVDGHGGIQSITDSTSGTEGDGRLHTLTITFADGTTNTVTLRDGYKGDPGDPGNPGDPGLDGTSIDHIDGPTTVGNVDTYTIILADGTEAGTFSVTNGTSIASIALTGSSGLTKTYTITLTDGTVGGTFTVTQGNGVTDISPVSAPHTPGQLDTYRITFGNGDTFDFQVYNGTNGAGSVSKVSGISPVNGDIKQVSHGAGAPTLSTAGNNNELYIDDNTGRLYLCSGAVDGSYVWRTAGSITIDDTLSGSSTNPVQNKVIKNALDGKAAGTHVHSGADIISGTVAVANGGTGSTSAAQARTALGITPANIGAATAAALTSHTGNTSNPHGVTAAQVGAATTGALSAHTGATTNPHGVTAAQVGAATTGALSAHTGNTSNPHAVTAAQVGAPALDGNGKVNADQAAAAMYGPDAGGSFVPGVFHWILHDGTYYLPAYAAVGTELEVFNNGSFTATISAGSATIISKEITSPVNAVTFKTQYGICGFKKLDSNRWLATGDVEL